MSGSIPRSSAKPVTINVRSEVARFAELMEAKLAKNDHKPHWRETLTPSDAYLRLMRETTELLEAMLCGDREAIVAEASDVANFSMMIADLASRRCRVCGCTDDDCRGCIERTGQPCWCTETAEAGVADR